MALQPPPRIIQKFTTEWKDWLYFLYEQVATVESDLDISGATLKVTEVSSTYTTVSTDEVIHADPTTAPFTVTLETGTTDRALYIKNTNTTNANNITVAGTIDGTVNATLTPLEAIHINYSITKAGWFVI